LEVALREDACKIHSGKAAEKIRQGTPYCLELPESGYAFQGRHPAEIEESRPGRTYLVDIFAG
jgi:hypothetical protein